MKGKYHVLELGSKGAEETIQKFCQTNGQMLLPVVDLITEPATEFGTPSQILSSRIAMA